MHDRVVEEVDGEAVPQVDCVTVHPTGKRLSASGTAPPICGIGPPAHAAAGESADSAWHEYIVLTLLGISQSWHPPAAPKMRTMSAPNAPIAPAESHITAAQTRPTVRD